MYRLPSGGYRRVQDLSSSPGHRACCYRVDFCGNSIPVWRELSGAGSNTQAPDLFLALMLQAAASPMMAAPALAALMGLDATLVLVTLIASTALIPLTAPLFTLVFVGPSLSISPLVLAAKLIAIPEGAALVGFVVRRVVGLAAIDRQEERINGLNDWWSLARPHLAVFRSFPVPHLSVAATPSTAGATDARTRTEHLPGGARAKNVIGRLQGLTG